MLFHFRHAGLASTGSGATQKELLNRDFILLFCLSMCSNANIAVFYCFEQWLEGLAISPNWRGLLISSMFAMPLLLRPAASFMLLRGGRLPALAVSTAALAAVMLGYLWVSGACIAVEVLTLRVIQGIAVAVQSSCVTSVLVNCIPPGQSARGFAFFSLTALLPYSIIPAVSENLLLPLLGGNDDATRLFALTTVLVTISLFLVIPLAPRLKKAELSDKTPGGVSRSALWNSVRNSGLLFIFLACLCFSTMTILSIFFMKGLCAITGGQPSLFFSTYTITIILLRLLAGKRLDALPRHGVSILCSLGLALCMLDFAWGPLWAFVPIACLYGLGIGLLYPLLASIVYNRSTPATRSLNSNVMMSAFDASGMLAPLAGGLLIHAGFSYQGVFTATAFSALLCGLWTLLDWLRFNRFEGRDTHNPTNF
ncbi:MAG: MFS transporter [Desulfovibrio sp.]|nr:MFS transporter [Desulfovibrio sp.]